MTDDLRDRLTEALRGAAHNCDDDCTRDDHTYLPLDQGDPERRWTINTTTGEILDAVMAVIEGLPNRGYCEHCGRGDCTPTAVQWDQERQRAEQAEALLRELVDDGDCHYDHHGQCQGHNLGYWPCEHARAKELLAALDQPKEQT